MNTTRRLFTAILMGLCVGSFVRAEFPRYSVTPTASFFPRLGPVGNPASPNLTFIYNVSAGGNNYLAGFADFEHRVTPSHFQSVVGAETNYIVSAETLNILNTGSPPPGFVTGTSGALRSSRVGHIVFSVLEPDDWNRPDWLERIRVARTAPDGTTTVLPGGLGIEQRGVNASGTVIGVGPDDLTAWRYTDALGWHNIGSLGPSGFAHPRGINDSGVIVGRSEDAQGNLRPFFYTDAGGMQAIITNNGEDVFGEAQAINNWGLVTGTGNGRVFTFNTETLEFRYITEAATGWRARDINELGAIIGASVFGDSILGIPVDSAFYWDADNGLSDLDGLIGDEVNDWFITDAWDINDNGWILGRGFRRADSTYHQVLLRPVPEPSAVSLFLAATAAMLGRRRKR